MRRRFWVAALVAVAVLLGIGTNVADARLRPYGMTASTGSMGEDVDAYPFRVHVNSARVAQTVATADSWDDAAPIGSDGLWVVVNLSYATATEPGSPSSTDLVLRDAQGREYPVSARSGSSEWMAGPDIWVRGELAFEVAPDAVDDLTLVFDPAFKLFGPMPMRYAVVPLELAGQEVLEATDLAAFELLAEGER